MSLQLVTLPQIKAHVEVDHDLSNELLEQKAEAAEAAVLQYLDDTFGDNFLDSTGVLETGVVGTGGEIPPQVVEAILQLTAILFKYRDDPNMEGKIQHGYLPFSVTMLLYPLRDPTLA